MVKTATLLSFIAASRRGFSKAFFTFALSSYWICPELPMVMLKSQAMPLVAKSDEG
jgi:hypothetical protein